MIENQYIKIREADLSDMETIALFQVAMAEETEEMILDKDDVIKGVEFIFNHPSRGFYLIAESEREIVGCLLILYEWSDWRNADVWWIHSVYVIEEYRGVGIFREMYDNIESLARGKRCAGLRLYVDKSNVNAQAVYEKIGMTKDHYELFEKML